MAFLDALKSSAVIGYLLLLSGAPSFASPAHIGPVATYFQTHVRQWLSDPLIIETLKARNKANAGLTIEEIKALDSAWIAEIESEHRPMIDKMLAEPASQFLRQREDDAAGTIAEIILMDARGINAAQSFVTSDFWQGDEDKFTKTFLIGPEAMFIDVARKDESSQIFQSQASVTIVDENGIPIGAITVGINLDQL